MTKIYPSQPPVDALRGVSFTVRRGELVAIVGPSGSGKTTLLHLMGTLDRPTSGTVRLTGIDVASMDDRDLAFLRATRIGFVFQQFFLSEHETALDNVADGLLYAGVRPAERRMLASAALNLVGLGGRPGARPTQLSGGQRQRVAIARALAGEPAIVLADEPTGNLDQTTGQSILALFEGLNQRGVTIVVITHDQGIAGRMPRRIEMLDGRIIADTGTALGPARRCLLPGAVMSTATLHRVPPDGRPPTCCGCPASGCAPASCAPGCPRWASPSGWPQSWPCSGCPRPPRPGCWPKSTGWAPTCSPSRTARPSSASPPSCPRTPRR